MVSLDFSKAYDTVHHNYFMAFFLHVGWPIPLTSLLMTIFKAQVIFAVGGWSKKSPSPPNPASSKETPPPRRYL